MLLTVSRESDFSQACQELNAILSTNGICPHSKERLSYGADPRSGNIEIRNSLLLEDLSMDKQQQLMLWKMQYSG